MERAISSFEELHEEDNEALLNFWPSAAVQMLLFTLSKDPSVRIRRAAMSLLTAVPAQHQSAQMGATVQLLVLKCRDKDAVVQRQAYSMLRQLPGEVLTDFLSIEDWRAILDTALLSCRAADGSISIDQELQASGCALLQQWLRLEQTCSAQSSPHVLTEGVNAVQQAAPYPQALQIPWNNAAIYQAYCTGLCVAEVHANLS